MLCIAVSVYGAELLHGIVEAIEITILVVERHGDERQIGQHLVFMYEVACGTVFLHLLCDVVDDIEDIGGASVFVEFTDGVSQEVEPMG